VSEEVDDNEIQHVPPRTRALVLKRIRQHIDNVGTDEDLLQEFLEQDGLALNSTTFDALKQEVYRQDSEALTSRAPEHYFRDIMSRAEKNLRRIDRFLERNEAEVILDETGEKQTVYLDPKAHIAAIKLSHEIQKSVVETGQSLQIIRRAPVTNVHVAGKAVAGMDKDELRQTIVQGFKDFHDLIMRFSGPMIDVTPRQGDERPALTEGPILEKPRFTDEGAPAMARGGLSKVVGAKASNR
jgi:hypothetical protein